MCTWGIILAQKIKHTHKHTLVSVFFSRTENNLETIWKRSSLWGFVLFFLQCKNFSLCVSLLLKKEKPMRDNTNGFQIPLSLNPSFPLHSEIAYGFVP